MMNRLITILILLSLISCNSIEKENLINDNDKFNRISGDKSWGFVNQKGDTIIPLGIYRFLNPIDEKRMIYAQKGDKYGYIDIKQDTLIPFIYDDLSVFSNGLAPAKLNSKWGYINRKGETVIGFEFDNESHFYNSGLAEASKNGKWGFIDKTGKDIIPILYEKVDRHKHEDSLVLVRNNNKWAFFSNTGKRLSDFIYNDVYGTSEHIDIFNDEYMFNGLILVKKDGKYGYLNRDLEVIIDFGYYSKAEQITEYGFAIVKKGSLYGVIDKTGELVIPLEYLLIKHPSQPYQGYYDEFYIKKNGKVGLLNEKAEILTEIIFDWFERDYCKINDTVQTVFLTKKENKFGFIDNKGKVTIAIEYEEISLFEGNNLSIAKKTGKYGLINGSGIVVKPVKFKSIYTYKDLNYYIFQTENYYGMLDKQSLDTIFPFEFQDIEQCFYDDNRFIVKKNGFYGIITRGMEEIFPFEFDEISNWVEYGPKEHFVVKKGKHGLISREGTVVIPPIYDDIKVDNSILIRVENNGLLGTINWKNEIVHPVEYEQIQWIWPYLEENGLDSIYVKKSGKYLITNIKGEIIKSNVSEKEFMDKFGFYIKLENEEYIPPPIPEREYEIIEDEDNEDFG